MSTAIEINNLAKKYLIKHQQKSQYGSLREEIMESVKRYRNRLLKPFTHQREGLCLTEEFWALKDVSFEVKQGDRVGIIGRNGAGKSTLLKILSRITEPTTGRVKLKGRVASLLEVGTGFHPELTGRENIFLNGAILGMSRAEIKKKFDEIVEFAEVERFLDTPVKRYSSGMYVRLAFAVAAHLEPEILIVDEVLAVGDAQFQKKCLGKMHDVGEQGRTILFVSHNMAAIKKLCSSAVLLKNGQVSYMGETDSVIGKYLQEYTIKNDQPFLAHNEHLGVKILNIEYLTHSNKPCLRLQTGSPITIKIPLLTEKKYNDLLVSIGFDTVDENHVCIFHSKINGATLELNPPRTEILCNIPRLNLAPGNYRISLKVMSGSEMLFWLPLFNEVEVEDGDFYGTGKLPDRNWSGVCLVDHSWKTQ